MVKSVLLDDVFKLAELAPDLSIGTAARILQWFADVRGTVEFTGSSDSSAAVADPVAVPAEPATGGAWSNTCPPVVAAPVSGAATGAATRKIPAAGKVAGKPAGKARRTGPRRGWTEEEIAEALTLRAEGLSHVQIGARMGRTGKAVIGALSARRLTRYQQGGGDHAAPGSSGKATDAGSDRKLGLSPDRDAGGRGSTPARVTDAAGQADGPALAEGRPAEGAAQQPAGHGAVGGVDVADVPRLDPAPVAAALPPRNNEPQLTGRQNRLVDHLGRLSSDDFAPEDDLFLAEELAKGVPGNVVADQLGCDLKTAVLRFRAMQTEEIINAKGTLTIDGQADLLAAVRYRVACHA